MLLVCPEEAGQRPGGEHWDLPFSALPLVFRVASGPTPRLVAEGQEMVCSRYSRRLGWLWLAPACGQLVQQLLEAEVSKTCSEGTFGVLETKEEEAQARAKG